MSPRARERAEPAEEVSVAAPPVSTTSQRFSPIRSARHASADGVSNMVSVVVLSLPLAATAARPANEKLITDT
jgi:hypothetical protein